MQRRENFFWWDCFFLMAVDLATNVDVDYRKDFSETERKLAAGSGIWKVQRRKLRTVVQPSSAVFHVILHFALLFGDWKKLAKASCIWKVQRRKLLAAVVPPSWAVFHGILRFYFFWIWVASVVEIERAKTSEIDKWEVFICQRKLQLKSSKFMFSWILGVGARSLLQEAPNVWPWHYWLDVNLY